MNSITNTKPAKKPFAKRARDLWNYFSLYEKIWFFSILILASVCAVIFPEEDVNGVKVLVTEMKGIETKELRNSVDGLKDQLKSGVIVLIKSEDGKASAAVGVTKDLVGKIKAGDVMKFVAEQLGGKGGGRPDFAQGGGAAPADMNALLGKTRTFITEKLA